jgi:early secretory antigenic target protein ESAT-6
MYDNTMVVNFAAMEHASDSIQRALTTLHARLEEVDKMGKRLSAGWTGSAKEAYELRQVGWQQAGGDMATTLKEIQVALNNAMHRYLETEKQNQGYFPSHR